MQRMLNGYEGTLVYLDDILIVGKTSGELNHRRNVVERILQDRCVLVNEKKSVRETNQVDWLGYDIWTDGIRPSGDKAERIRNLPTPTSVKELRQVMGIVNYYCRFVPHLATLAHPLFERLKKKRYWRWEQWKLTP